MISRAGYVGIVGLTCLALSCSFNPGAKASSAADAPSEGSDGGSDGSLVVDATSGSEAIPLCGTTPCAAAGGSCTNDVCVIDQDSQNAVMCPAGMPCKVVCDTVDACSDGVRCGLATTCEVQCIGANTCKAQGVDCGMATTCTVECNGTDSCQHGPGGDVSIDCRTSTCTVTCTGNKSCEDGFNVDPPGSCTSHCCSGCAANTSACNNDNTCT